jgi:hypothetical protein
MERIKAGVMPMLYTGRIQANSSANYARNQYSQLHDGGVNDRDISLLQGKGFKDDTINASSRATQSASRFNYAFDRQINKRFVDVSGQFIPNNKLRILPNRSCSMWGGGQVLPKPYVDADLQQLSESLMRDSVNRTLAYNPADANSYMKYKATRPKLTRQDLMDAAQQYSRRTAQALPVVGVVGGGATAPNTARTTASSVSGVSGGLSARTTELIDQARRRRELSVQIPYTMQVGEMP